jgi:hypothetical protein
MRRRRDTAVHGAREIGVRISAESTVLRGFGVAADAKGARKNPAESWETRVGFLE